MPLITREEAIKSGIPHHTLQTILINKKFSLSEAKKWLAMHNYANSYYRTTRHFYRFMQTPPIEGAKYHTKKLPNGIELVYQFLS